MLSILFTSLSHFLSSLPSSFRYLSLSRSPVLFIYVLIVSSPSSLPLCFCLDGLSSKYSVISLTCSSAHTGPPLSPHTHTHTHTHTLTSLCVCVCVCASSSSRFWSKCQSISHANDLKCISLSLSLCLSSLAPSSCSVKPREARLYVTEKTQRIRAREIIGAESGGICGENETARRSPRGCWGTNHMDLTVEDRVCVLLLCLKRDDRGKMVVWVFS